MQIHIIIFEDKQFKLTKSLVITYTKESYTLPACLDIIYISLVTYCCSTSIFCWNLIFMKQQNMWKQNCRKYFADKNQPEN